LSKQKKTLQNRNDANLMEKTRNPRDQKRSKSKSKSAVEGVGSAQPESQNKTENFQDVQEKKEEEKTDVNSEQEGTQAGNGLSSFQSSNENLSEKNGSELVDVPGKELKEMQEDHQTVSKDVQMPRQLEESESSKFEAEKNNERIKTIVNYEMNKLPRNTSEEIQNNVEKLLKIHVGKNGVLEDFQDDLKEIFDAVKHYEALRHADKNDELKNEELRRLDFLFSGKWTNLVHDLNCIAEARNLLKD